MTEAEIVTVAVIIAAAAFDFINGFHDAANSIATIVATKIMKPRHAVLWAGIFNFMALFLFGTGVAKTVGSGMVDLAAVTPLVILSGLLGAIMWGVITWWKGIPTSSSHALLGGYAGAAMCHAGLTKGVAVIGSPILASGWIITLLFIVVAPGLGLLLGGALMKITMRLRKKFPGDMSDTFFARAQLVSSAFLSLMHGSNDAQKTAGIIAGALVAGGFTKEFTLPFWVLCLSYGMMGLGTLVGGWRIVDTLGRKLTRLKPDGGCCAESSAALSILLATMLHLPVSTTHVTTGAILGVGSARNPRAVRWTVAQGIAWAWVITIPISALFGAVLCWLSRPLSHF